MDENNDVPTQQSTMTSFASFEQAISGGNISVVSVSRSRMRRSMRKGKAEVVVLIQVHTLDELEDGRFGQPDIVVPSFPI